VAYISWRSEAINGTHVYAATTNSYQVGNGFPLDLRTLKNTASAVFTVSTGLRYPGLKVYTEDNKEYVFRLNASFALPNEYVREYHPELVHYAEVEGTTLPDNLISVLGDGVVTYNSVSYSTMPVGTGGIIKLGDGSLYQFVWDGTDWTTFANSGPGSGVIAGAIINFTSGDNIDSLNELTSSLVDSKYRSTYELGESDPIVAGTEVTAIYTTDTPAVETSRKYVYLNSAWRIFRGIQEYLFSFSSYSSWSAGDFYGSDWPSEVSVIQSSTEGIVDIIITHQFESHYIDVLVFEYLGTVGTDTNYGDRLLVKSSCYKTSGGAFQTKVSLPVSMSDISSYIVVLQK